jgi:nitrogen fixation protein FixH
MENIARFVQRTAADVEGTTLAVDLRSQGLQHAQRGLAVGAWAVIFDARFAV